MRTFILSLLAAFLLFGADMATAAPKTHAVKEVQDRGEIDKIKCDSMTSDSVRLGESLNFWVDLTVKDTKVQVTDVNYWFWADKDYNGAEGTFTLAPTKELEQANWIVDNRKMRLLESTDYHVTVLPDHPSAENMLFKGQILFQRINSDGSVSPETESFVGCIRYAVKK